MGRKEAPALFTTVFKDIDQDLDVQRRLQETFGMGTFTGIEIALKDPLTKPFICEKAAEIIAAKLIPTPYFDTTHLSKKIREANGQLPQRVATALVGTAISLLLETK